MYCPPLMSIIAPVIHPAKGEQRLVALGADLMVIAEMIDDLAGDGLAGREGHDHVRPALAQEMRRDLTDPSGTAGHAGHPPEERPVVVQISRVAQPDVTVPHGSSSTARATASPPPRQRVAKPVESPR